MVNGKGCFLGHKFNNGTIFYNIIIYGPRYMPPELTSSFFGEKMTKATKAIFWVCQLALLAQPIWMEDLDDIYHRNEKFRFK